MAVIPARQAPARSPGTRRALRVVLNANASGAGVAVQAGDLLASLRAYGADVELERTHSLDDLAAVWGTDDGRRLVLVGGDGTVHEAANLGPGPRDLALIPAGRANNIARSLGIPVDWRAAAALAVHGRVRPIDLIEARAPGRRRLVVEGVSVGFLAQARVRYHGRNSADLLAGVRAGAAALARFHPLAARVTGSDGAETLHFSQLFVANLPLYEFGLRVAPHADPVDATLDIVAIEAPSRRAVLGMLLDLRRGTHLDRPNVHTWRTPTATIDTGGCSPVVADSTDMGPGTVFLRAAPAALRLVRP
jgi:diacylglycerol kinase (ATP)